MAKFAIEFGVPEMLALWEDLSSKAENEELDGEEKALWKKFFKAINFLAENPQHPGFVSHEISSLTKRYGSRVWQSYLENRKAAAGRLYHR